MPRMTTVNRAALVTALVLIFPGLSFAADPGPHQFPLLGIGIGQTLRLNAVATEGGAGCEATVSFVDQNGTPVGRDPGPHQLNLRPGQAGFADLPSSLMLSRVGQRMELRPVIAFAEISPTTGAAPPTDCTFGVELFDSTTGFSRVFTNPDPAQLPDGTVDYDLMGVAFGQVARLNAVTVSPGPAQDPALPPSPCLVTLGFVDQMGTPVGRDPGPQQLDPGQGTFLNFPASLLVNALGERALVRPTVKVESVPGAGACPGIVTVAETFERLTGRTWAAHPPNPNKPPNPN